MQRGQFQGTKSLGGSSQSQSQRPAKGFWAKLRRALSYGWLKTVFLYRKSRTMIWFGTTGIIFLIAPFAFSHFLEVSEELQKISSIQK